MRSFRGFGSLFVRSGEVTVECFQQQLRALPESTPFSSTLRADREYALWADQGVSQPSSIDTIAKASTVHVQPNPYLCCGNILGT